MSGVDVGHEVRFQAGAPVGPQGLGDHLRAEVGAADADVHHVGDALAGMTPPVASSDGVGEAAHPRQNGSHHRHHVLAVDVDRAIRTVAQRHVQHRPVLGAVDFFAVEHPLDGGADPGLFRQPDEQRHRLGGDEVLRVVEQELVDRY